MEPSCTVGVLSYVRDGRVQNCSGKGQPTPVLTQFDLVVYPLPSLEMGNEEDPGALMVEYLRRKSRLEGQGQAEELTRSASAGG